MRFWTAPSYFFNHGFNNVAAVFYERYPNSHAKHILSEDVLSREVYNDKIFTKKLIVKEGASFLKAMPSWISQKAAARIIPTIEESIFDRTKNTLITYTRNVAWRNIAKMDEKCSYVPEDATRTKLERSLAVDVNYGRFSGFIEKVMMVKFRGSIKKTLAGFNEKLDEKFPKPHSGNLTDRARQLKDNLVSNNSLKWDKA